MSVRCIWISLTRCCWCWQQVPKKSSRSLPCTYEFAAGFNIQFFIKLWYPMLSQMFYFVIVWLITYCNANYYFFPTINTQQIELRLTRMRFLLERRSERRSHGQCEYKNSEVEEHYNYFYSFICISMNWYVWQYWTFPWCIVARFFDRVPISWIFVGDYSYSNSIH